MTLTLLDGDEVSVGEGTNENEGGVSVARDSASDDDGEEVS